MKKLMGITLSAGIAAVYTALGRTASGKVAVKISTGEPGVRTD